MDTRSIGSLRVSTVGLGCNNFGWHLDEPASQAVVHAALDAGITHFDTADVYGDGESERMLGRALGTRRADVVIATKFGNKTDGRPETVARSAEASLKRLGTDVIDLYYLPHARRGDAHRRHARRARASRRGRQRARDRVLQLLGRADARGRGGRASASRFVANQGEYSLLHRAPETNGELDACRALGLAYVPYFPLKSGLLTGKYRTRPRRARGHAPRRRHRGQRLPEHGRPPAHATTNLDTVEALIGWAEAHGRTILDVAFAFLLARQDVASVIAGATKPSQIASNVAAARDAADGRRGERDRGAARRRRLTAFTVFARPEQTGGCGRRLRAWCRGRAVRHRSAKPATAVQVRSAPPDAPARPVSGGRAACQRECASGRVRGRRLGRARHDVEHLGRRAGPVGTGRPSPAPSRPSS